MRASASQKMTLSAMSTALSVLFLYLAYVLPSMKIACMFIASLFVYTLLSDGSYMYAILTYIAASLLAFLIVPNKLYPIAYAGLVGHYAIFKVFIDTHVSSKIIGSCIKLLYCNAFFAAGIAIAIYVLKIEIPEVAFPKWAIVLIAEVALIAVDLIQVLCFHMYNEWIKPHILPRY